MMKSLTKSNLASRVMSASKVAMTAATVAVASVAFASVAEAAQFTINYQGNDRTFDISTVTDNRTDIINLLEDSPWWGDQDLAAALAEKVGFSLGYDGPDPTFLAQGPYFVYNVSGNTVWNANYFSEFGWTEVSSTGFFDVDAPQLYAYGSEVPPNPIPTPALLPGLVGMGVAALRKRNGEAAETEA